MKINDGSSWQEAKSLKLNNGSSWVPAKKAYVYNNGWQIAYPNLPASLGTPTFTHTGTTYRGQVGAILTVNSSWNSDPAYAPVSYTYQWKRGSSSISGATSQTYTAVVADIDQILSCTITATNGRGNTVVTGDIGTIILPTVTSMTASDITSTPSQPSVTISKSGLSYSGSWTASSNATSYSVTTSNGSITDNGNRTFNGTGTAGNASVTITPINTNKQVYMYWTAAPGAVSYDVVKYGNSVETVINVPSSQLNYTWSIADGNEGNYFSVYPRSTSYQGYGIQTSLTVSNKSGTAGSASISIGCTAQWVDADWTYGGVTWSGNCINSVESGSYSWRYRLYQYSDCTQDNIIEYGTYATSRACTPTCTAGWQAGSEYTYNSITWSGTCGSNSIEGGTAANRTRTWVNADCTTETRTEYGPFYQSRACTYVACVCNYTTTPTQSYHFAPESCPGGSTRAGSLSGVTVNANCPNVSKTATGKYACKSYDVTNSASSNYSTCYYEGDCDARYNSDGTRAACYA
jgi:hypothetical protein